jgi:site-specific DNA-methyltransferase (adenine-specific)
MAPRFAGKAESFIRPAYLGPVPALAEAPTLPSGILHGDCVTVMATLPAASIDLVLTDPPYGCNYRDRAGRRVANDNRTDWLEPEFAEVARLMKPDSLCVSFYGWHVVDQFMAAWRVAGLRPVAHLVFPKRYASRVGTFEARHEQAYVLAKGHPTVPSPIADVLPWAYTGNRLHPTQKPTEALAPIIAALTRPGDLVLDPFAGSGSTLVAAQSLGRAFIGIELDARHVRTARRRLAL